MVSGRRGPRRADGDGRHPPNRHRRGRLGPDPLPGGVLTWTDTGGSPTPRSPRPTTPRSPDAAGRARHRPADRAPGATPQPCQLPAGQGEAFAVYRYHAVFTNSPGRCWPPRPPPRPRRHRAGHRRAEERPAGPPALGKLHRQCRLAGLRRDLAQPDPGRRRAGRRPPPPVPHRHHPRPADHHPGRLAHSAHQQTVHLPRDWPFEPGLDELFRRALHDPLPAA